MMTRRLGRTDIEVTPIGLGCWQFSQGQGLAGAAWANVDQETITAIVRAARAGGISWFDTAEAYGNGRSEQALSKALRALDVPPGSALIATKWQPVLRRARTIGTSIDRRLECLSPYPVGLFQVHNPLSVSSIRAQMEEMARLVKAAKVRAVGVSNFSASQMEAAHAALDREGVRLASNQVRISLLHRRVETNGVLAAARRLGVTLIAWSPLAQGILTGRFHRDRSASRRVSPARRLLGGHSESAIRRTAPLAAELESVAKSHGAAPAQVALAWLVGFYGDTVVAIPGATRPGQAEESAAAMHLRLGGAELARLGEVAKVCTV